MKQLASQEREARGKQVTCKLLGVLMLAHLLSRRRNAAAAAPAAAAAVSVSAHGGRAAVADEEMEQANVLLEDQ